MRQKLLHCRRKWSRRKRSPVAVHDNHVSQNQDAQTPTMSYNTSPRQHQPDNTYDYTTVSDIPPPLPPLRDLEQFPTLARQQPETEPEQDSAAGPMYHVLDPECACANAPQSEGIFRNVECRKEAECRYSKGPVLLTKVRSSRLNQSPHQSTRPSRGQSPMPSPRQSPRQSPRPASRKTAVGSPVPSPRVSPKPSPRASPRPSPRASPSSVPRARPSRPHHDRGNIDRQSDPQPQSHSTGQTVDREIEVLENQAYQTDDVIEKTKSS